MQTDNNNHFCHLNMKKKQISSLKSRVFESTSVVNSETLKTHHNQDIEEFSIIEDRMIRKEYQIEKEKDEQLNKMKSYTTEMMKSLKIQQQLLEYVKDKMKIS
ncbi:unnamed protein product (macronuclear) [Paramecium tetraurelia]|uniref:Uncharacterized protein n=1 Tax=Paramecium tetraurelia TaxID=5888 RepID=A0CGQ5_PARTE|nr:uncharacterized protein GSPATT00007412001 [Paramecium tetraurelia]CAK69972.1 unnamed protein product [Paramecium tetraurelia]|eukprot:XP_001437369.1 hypothetical protein (macronuclear) [Paramecium tetraurelia strain d4-2]